VECGSEALCADERLDEVAHHVDLCHLILIQPHIISAVAAAANGGGVGASTSKVLSLAPDDWVVEQVEPVSDELAFKVRRLTSVQCPRLRLGQHVNRQRYIHTTTITITTG